MFTHLLGHYLLHLESQRTQTQNFKQLNDKKQPTQLEGIDAASTEIFAIRILQAYKQNRTFKIQLYPSLSSTTEQAVPANNT